MKKKSGAGAGKKIAGSPALHDTRRVQWSFGWPGDSFLFEGKVSHVRSLNEIGEKHSLRWSTITTPLIALGFPSMYYKGKPTEVEERLAEQIFVCNNTPRYVFTPREKATGETTSLPSLEQGVFDRKTMEFQTLKQCKYQLHTQGMVRFQYSKGEIVHFEGTRNRKGIGTKVHSNSKYHIIGHSGTTTWHFKP